MLLVVAATDFEMDPFSAFCTNLNGIERLITGIGPVETAVRLTHRLGQSKRSKFSCVVNFGVAGAYKSARPAQVLASGHKRNLQSAAESGREDRRCPAKKISQRPDVRLLDICLAEREILGDLGILSNDRIERFTTGPLEVADTFFLDSKLFNFAGNMLSKKKVSFHSGTFITVSCVSGTVNRGELVAREHGGLCENMEGAAVARVCKEFSLPCLEIRCISNMVGERDKSKWQLKNACSKAAAVSAMVIEQLLLTSVASGKA